MAQRMTAVAAALALAAGLAGAADSHTLSGTFTKSGIEDGTNGYLKLVAEGDNCTDPGPGVAATMATFAEGQAAYSLEDVAAGAYTACAFIDANAEEGQVIANSGDYGSMRPVTIEGDTTLDFEDAAWMAIP